MSTTLIQQFDLLASSLGGVAKLRELILSLAVRGKLVPQNPADEPASMLLQKIRAEKERLIAEGKIKKDKPLSPISDEEKPFELPEGWEWVRLDHIGSTFIGLTYSPEDVSASNDGIPVLRSSNIQRNKIDLHDLVRVKIDVKQGLIVEDGDLLICARNGSKALVGKAAIIKGLNEPMTFGAFMAIYKSRLNSFIEIFIQSPMFRNMLEGVATTTINQITQSNLKQTVIALPPLPEQSRIVAKVEQLLALCDRLEAEQGQAARTQGHWVEAALAQLADSADADDFARHWQHLAQHFDTLFTTPDSITQLEATLLQLAVRGKLVPQDPSDEPASALLQKIRTEKDRLLAEGKIKKDKSLPPISDEEKPFELPKGWEWGRLVDLCSLITDGTHQTPKYVSNGKPFLSAQNVKPFRFLANDYKYVSEADFNTLRKNRTPERGDILLTRVGAMIGEAAVIDTDLEFAFYVSLALLKPHKPFLDSRYIVLWLNSPYGTSSSIKNTLGRGVSAGNLNLSLIRKFVLPVPPIAEQPRIVAKLDALLALTARLKTQLAKAQQMQALLADVLLETST